MENTSCLMPRDEFVCNHACELMRTMKCVRFFVSACVHLCANVIAKTCVNCGTCEVEIVAI